MLQFGMRQDIANLRRHLSCEKTFIRNALITRHLNHLIINQKLYGQRVMHDSLFLLAALLIAL